MVWGCPQIFFVGSARASRTGNGSTAWCVFIGATSQYLFGALPTSQLKKMLANPNVITSGVFADSGTAEEKRGMGSPVI